MSDVEKRLEVLGIELPVRNRKGKGAVAAVLDGDMLYVSGHLPYTESGELLYKGKVGGNLTQEEGYAAARQLVETYAVKVDPALHAEVLERYKRLNLAPYKGFVNPRYEAVKDAGGNITDVKVSYSEGYAEQMLRYSRDYSNLPSVN